VGLEPIAKDRHQLIHHYIPALALGPAMAEVADIQKQNLDHEFIGRKYLAHLGVQALMALVV
jgi:hypothetical protein